MPGVIHMPGVIGQHGFIDHGDMSMHADASFAVLNFINYYRYTQNATFVKETSYPLIRGVAAWWMCWLKKTELPGGEIRYDDTHDCTYENCMWCGDDFEPQRYPLRDCHTANNVNPGNQLSPLFFSFSYLVLFFICAVLLSAMFSALLCSVLICCCLYLCAVRCSDHDLVRSLHPFAFG